MWKTKPKNGEYVAPEIDVMEIRSLGILCGSTREMDVNPEEVDFDKIFGE